MPRERGIKFSVLKKVNNDLNPFGFIIYKQRNSNKIIFEQPQTGKMYEGPEHEMKKFIKINGVSTPWMLDSLDNPTKMENDYLEHAPKMLYTTKYFQFKFEIGHYFFSHQINVDQLVDNLSSLDNFEVDVESRTFYVNLPLLPFYIEFRKENDRCVFKYLFMQSGNKFYNFPYGNTGANGGICLGRSRFKNANDAFIQLVDATSNTDLTFQLRNININNVIPASDKQDFNEYYNIDNIHESLLEGQRLELTQTLYYLANINIENLNPDLVFIESNPTWKHLLTREE